MSSGEGEVTIDDLLAEIQPRIVTVRVLLRQEMLIEHRRLDAELAEAIHYDAAHNEEDTAPAIAARLLDLEASIEAAKREFVFRAVGKRRWADLLAKHPPTKDQQAAFKAQVSFGGLDHNPDTFPVVAIAASCTSPQMSEEQVRQFEAVLDLAQWEQLWSACLDANMGGGDSPKSVLAGPIARVNAELGITPVPTASLDQSSLDGS